MQNAGQQYGQGGASSHQTAPFGHTTEPTQTTNSGSITSSLRQFRKDKQVLSDTNVPTTVAESHVARVAPHNHYPPNRSNECFRYPPSQYQEYGVSSQVKYSEISGGGPSPLQKPTTPPTSVIQKAKGGKEYMDLCNVQPHMKQPYPEHHHINGQQGYPEANLHGQYMHKEPQVHTSYKPESQYFPKDQYSSQMSSHHIQKYNMPTQVRKYPTSNDFLSKLERIHPTMARSIISDHHLQESPSPYRGMDQNRIYPPQNQRYLNYPPSNNPYTPHGYAPSHPQSYQNYPASCSYNRGSHPSQMGGPRFPSLNPHERSLSPRRNFQENVGMPPMNYGGVQQKITSPNYGHQYNTTPEYAQHYQHRRAAMAQDYYQQNCRPTQYLPHQLTNQELSENRLTVSDNLKQYIENWADEETATEMQMDNGTICKENLRMRDDQSAETAVYMINASQLQYLENGIPLVASDNTIPLVASENGQYILKNGVSIDNASGMVRIVNKSNQMDLLENNQDRVVNLHIMDQLKPDCMLAKKPNDINQRQNESLFEVSEKPRVVVHQNTVIQPSYSGLNINKEKERSGVLNVGSSLPIITDGEPEIEGKSFEDEIKRSIIKECRKETVDKNCSPINLNEIEEYKGDFLQSSVICSNNSKENEKRDKPDVLDHLENKLKNMPTIEEICEVALKSTEFNERTHVDDNIIKQETIDAPEMLDTKKNVVLESTPTLSLEDTLENSEETVPSVRISDGEDPEKLENMNLNEESSGISELESNILSLPEEISSDVEIITKDELPVKAQDVSNYDNHSSAMEEKPAADKENKIADLATDNSKIKEPTENTDSIFKPAIKNLVSSKRSRRFFSVDDIINNIGNNINRHKSDEIKRRRSLQCTKEFLQNEVQCTFKINDCQITTDIEEKLTSGGNNENDMLKEKIVKENKEVENVIHTVAKKEKGERLLKSHHQENSPELEKRNCSNIKETKNKKDDTDKETMPTIKNKEQEKIAMLSADGDSIEKTANDRQKNVDNNLLEIKKTDNIVENVDDTGNTKDGLEDNKVTKKPIEEVIMVTELKQSECEIEKDIHQVSQMLDPLECDSINNIPDKNTDDNEKPQIGAHENSSASIVGAETTNQRFLEESIVPETNEVQYRNVIRVEDNSILLHIAGELVEINVNNINGKKVITVVPLSHSTVVDFNDNYDTFNNTETCDPLRIDDMITDSNDNFTGHVNEIITAPEIVEPTSEIIIGMDLSLEEEIKLDLEQPKVLCTKAAKKSYDNDLQIPSITTSADVYDQNKTESYLGNDKVSSSREHPDKANKKCSKVNLSKKQDISNKRDKKIIKDSVKARKNKKTCNANVVEEDDDEFIPFVELVKARKRRKMRLKEKKKEDVKADSTNKVDEISKEDKVESLEPHYENNVKETETKLETPNNNMSKTEAINAESSDSQSKVTQITSSNRDKTSKSVASEKNPEKPHETMQNILSDDQKTKIDENLEKCDKSDKISNKIIEKSEQKLKVTKSNKEKCKVDDTEQKNTKVVTEIRNHNLTDPRLQEKKAEVVDGKRKLSLQEYNNRKRKLLAAEKSEGEASPKKNVKENKPAVEKQGNFEIKPSSSKPDKIKFPRPKSLDDLSKPNVKENSVHKRKFSLDNAPKPPSFFDWEETQSPKINFNHASEDKRFCEFRGLINTTKIINPTPELNNGSKKLVDHSEDEILQNYKEQVESKLSSLNIQIPRIVKQPNPIRSGSQSESFGFIQRFLRNDKLSVEEVEKIKKIITCKRVAQQLKSPTNSTALLNPSYEIRKEMEEKDIKLHLKKMPEKKKARFKNLHTESNSESEEDLQKKKNAGDYSVVQSNCLAGVVPKLIIKRKTEIPLPIVRLERLDLGILINKKRKFAE